MPIIKQKICFVLTAEFAVKAFLLNHLRVLSQFYDITVIVNTDNPNFLAEIGVNAKVIPLKIARDISLFLDLICLLKLVKIFYQQSFSAVHSITPKAGLLAMLAAWINQLPLRVHTFTGQVWATKSGYKRFFLKQVDCLIASLTTHNMVDSPSQCKFLVGEKVITPEKSIVFGQGSISGVDLLRFKPNQQTKKNIRQQLNIDTDAIIFLFVGRLTKDKGVLDLAWAFSMLTGANSHLLFVGPDEQNVQKEIMQITTACSAYVHFVGHTNQPESYMAAADVLCLPSYREGFGSVVIEAAAAGIPTIASRIYGLTDALVDSETGLLHEPGNIEDIKNKMRLLIESKPFRLNLGLEARIRTIKYFDCQAITQDWLKFYQENVH